MSRLVLVPTPIGNLGDLTFRARDELAAADVVAAEDTRHSRTLLLHYGIDRPLTRLDAHTAAERAPELLARHARVAFVSDAGTPGISDPGADLIRIARAAGHEVAALPGATAVVPALVLSGLPTARFAFEGFLPRKGADRRARLAAISARPSPTVLYESPRRLAATLGDLRGGCGGGRPASVSRELTKLHEETVRGTLDELLDRFGEGGTRGEVVLVVGGAEAPAEADQGAQHRRTAEALRTAGLEGTTLKRALQALGVPRNDAYRLSVNADPPRP